MSVSAVSFSAVRSRCLSSPAFVAVGFRSSPRSFSGCVAVPLFRSVASARACAVWAGGVVGRSCVVRRLGAFFGVYVPCLPRSPRPASPPFLRPVVPASSPVSLPGVGFSGSRSLSGASASFAASFALRFSSLGARAFVGCARGLDAVVRSSLPLARVFRVSLPLSRAAFARRSVRLVRALPAGSAFFVFPGGACPASVGPAPSWRAGGSGSWSSAALAAGRGLSVFVFVPLSSSGASAFPLPAWSGSWRASVRFRCFFRFVPAPGLFG